MMAANANTARLKRITNGAKAIRKKHPGMSWQNAIKASAKAIKGGKKVSGTKKSSPKKVKKVATKKRVSGISKPRRAVGSVAHTRSKLKKQLEEQLAWGLLARDSAKKVSDRKKKSKKVTELKRELRAINGIGKRKRRR